MENYATENLNYERNGAQKAQEVQKAQKAQKAQKVQKFQRKPPSEYLESVFRAAEENDYPKEAMQFYHPKVRRLVRFLFELAVAKKGRPFFLSARNASELIGVGATQVGRWLFMLEESGILRRRKTGDTHKANEYLYVSELR